MTDETAEQVLTRVLLHHQPMLADDGKYIECQRCAIDGWTATDAEDADHVAAELAAALRSAGLLVEGETTTEEMYASPDFKRLASVKYVKAGHIDPRGMRLLSRQRTRYPDRVTDWEEVR